MLLVVKKIDLGLQILFFSVGLLSGLRESVDLFIAMYFVLGGWQVGSCLVHHFALPQSRSATRRHYAWTIAIIGILTVVTIPLFLITGFGLLIASPFIAIWYGLICYNEIKSYAWRNSFHMKN